MKKLVGLTVFYAVLFTRLFCMNAFNDNRLTLVRATRSLQGNYRETMEDRYHNEPNASIPFFGVYDGHGGAEAAEYCKENLFKNIYENENFEANKALALHEGFLKTDAEFQEKGGTTAVCLLCDGDTLWIANAGDSHAVLYREDGKVIEQLSYDHNLSNDQEFQAVLALGGEIRTRKEPTERCTLVGYGEKCMERVEIQKISLSWVYRPDGIRGLAMSHAIGNHDIKPFVAPDAYVREFKLDGSEGFLVLASDGLWDTVTNEAVGQFIDFHLQLYDETCQTITENIAHLIVHDLVGEALKIDDHDNVTATIIFFKRPR